MAVTLVLLDESAYVRGSVADVEEADELCLCAVTRLELLYSARSHAHYERLDADLMAFRDLRMDAETFSIAVGAQREPAVTVTTASPVPDVLIAACAHQYGADVLHVDRHYDVLARVLSSHAAPRVIRTPCAGQRGWPSVAHGARGALASGCPTAPRAGEDKGARKSASTSGDIR